jgi:hypothetical protein
MQATLWIMNKEVVITAGNGLILWNMIFYLCSFNESSMFNITYYLFVSYYK